MIPPIFRNVNLKKSRDVQIDFRGLNKNFYVGENEFASMKNMSSTHYPVLSPREKRSIYTSEETGKINGIFSANGKLAYVRGNRFHYGAYSGELKALHDRTKRSLVSMGANIVIFPDKMIFNTEAVEKKEIIFTGLINIITAVGDDRMIFMGEGIDKHFNKNDKIKVSGSGSVFVDTIHKVIDVKPNMVQVDTIASFGGINNDLLTIEKVFDSTIGELTIENLDATYSGLVNIVCRLKGESNKGVNEYIGNETPANPMDKDIWISYDSVKDQNVLKQYNALSAMWFEIPEVWLVLSAEGIGKEFKVGDSVEILSDYENFENIIIGEASENEIRVAVSSKYYGGARLIEATITRKIPDMDFICEHNNRLWGCSSEKHEIYASKLGDPKNFYSYTGISTDSYAATIGSDGEFTGCTSYLGNVLFFKENVIHKIYGSKPSNFQITDSLVKGVEKGSEESLCIVNGVLYYKSREGVCAYDGNAPIDISSALGAMQYTKASAGAFGDKYYISMCEGFEEYSLMRVASNNPHENYSLFVYDTKKGLWHREDDSGANGFANVNGALYFVLINTVAGVGNDVIGIGETEEISLFNKVDEENFEWDVETGDILYAETHKKYVSRINVKLSLDVGSEFRAYIKYDNGNWEKAGEITNGTRKTYLFPIRTKRSDNIRVRFEGKGDVKVFAVSKTLEVGSDI